jgi:hypothetical protein
MNFSSNTRICAGKLLLLAMGAAVALSAGPPSKDTLVFTPQTDSSGFSPYDDGNSWFYTSTVPSGTAVADTIPVQFVLNDTNGTPEINPYTVSWAAVGQIAGSISFSTSSFSMSDGGSATHYIYINTTNLAPGDYMANVQVSATPANLVGVSHGPIHIQIHVVDPADPPSCYITDSNGLKLQDCGGQAVSTGGEFLVVANAKKITATNPGQFYYNLVWQNGTGSDVTFTSLFLTGSNVVPAGANSVHVLVYNANQFTASFDDVNTNGIPCGQSGTACKSPIAVPAGQTLWLTWHVAYQWAGSPLWPDIASLAACPAQSLHGTIGMNALLENAEGTVSLACGGTATGYTAK